MHGLEHLEDKWITGGSRFNSVGKGNINEVDKKGRGKECNVVIIVVGWREEVRSVREGVRTS